MAKKKKAGRKNQLKENKNREKAISYDWIDIVNFWLVLLAIFFVPVVFSTQTFDPFDLIKNYVFRIIVSLMFFFFALKLALRREVRFVYHPASYFLFAFLIWVFVATLDSVVPMTSLIGKYRRFEGLIAFFTYGVFFWLTVDIFARDKRRIESAVKVALFTGILISTYGIMQFLGYDFFRWGKLPFEARRSFATLGNPALLAGYLVTIFPLALGMAIFSKRPFNLALGTVATILSFTCLITAFNRTSWIAALLALICLAVIIWYLHRKKAVEKWAVTNMVLTVTILLIVFVLLALVSQLQKTPLTVTERIKQLTEFGGGSFAHRLEIWKAGLRMINADPLTGLGPDTFRATSRMYQGERYGHIAPDIVADNAHNYELQIAAGTGMVGFLFLAAFIIYVFFEGLRVIYLRAFTDGGGIHFETTRDLAGLGINLGLLLSFLAYFFQLLTSVSIIGSTLMWWFSFAAILSQGTALKEKTVRLASTAKAIMLAVLVALLAAFIYFNTRLLIADHYYFKAKGATGYPAFIYEQEMLIKKAMQLNPWQWDYPAEMARSYFIAYRYTNSKEMLERALHYALLAESIDPFEADVKAILAQIYLERSQFDPASIAEAEAVALKMTELMPHHYISWLLLGECYYLQGRLQEAIEALEEAVRNNPRSDQAYYYLSKAYEKLGNKQMASRYMKKALEINPNIGK